MAKCRKKWIEGLRFSVYGFQFTVFSFRFTVYCLFSFSEVSDLLILFGSSILVLGSYLVLESWFLVLAFRHFLPTSEEAKPH